MFRYRVVYALMTVAMALSVACGKKSPTQPTPQQSTSAGQSFVGSVTLPAGAGVVVINSTSRVAAAPENPFERLLSLLEPRLLAQSGSADGVLLLPDGTTVSLSGTVSGSTFQLSGEGGYSVTATASGGTISGSVTTPAGAGTVSPMGYAAPYVPPAGTPTGVYQTTYSMSANGYLRTVRPPSQVPWRDCRVATELTGTLRLEVEAADPEIPGFYHMDLRDTWRETTTILRPCEDALSFSPQVLEPVGTGIGKSAPQDPANIQFAMRDAGGVNGGGRRDYVFVGRFNGTTIDGVFIKSRTWTNVEGSNQHSEGYPATRMTVTLRK